MKNTNSKDASKRFIERCVKAGFTKKQAELLWEIWSKNYMYS